MSDFNVDPSVYSTAATSLNQYGTDFHTVFQTQMTALSDTKDMGGTVGDCGLWASSYDTTTSEAYGLASSLVQAIDNYAGILQQAGYNYAVADYRPGTGRPEPTAPVQLPMAWSTCPIPPPSAGGPGSGLVDDGFELASQAGIPIPDGDPDKLLKAADLWDALAKHDSVAGLPAKLEAIAKNFETVTAPEASFIDEDLREMKTAAEDICTTFSDIAQSCRDQKTAIDDLRSQLKTLLEDLAEDIAQEVAVTLVFSAVAGALSAGFGAAAVAAYRVGKIAIKVKSYATKIKNIVDNVKLLNKIVKKKDTATTKQKLQRIVDLVKRARQLGTPARPSHVPEGWEPRIADNGKGWVWQKPGSTYNQNMFRDALPDAKYPNGYVRFYNENGQPLKLDGKPGSNAETHIPKNPDGTYPTPDGW
ncbi:hypothetical protein IU501_35975 [Nocardia otitidiscaviarum]|uniref:hypothetical protein n=1 Tax=Nocardia otitidiscaviarum TaxID=1823 RepID=UPI0011DE1AA2|nr:hypothetical protein [Nocardia otitidiscaviarum]MBF6138373.1 hypothetical protein [Nocardia otitidiscaviarum]MBF6483525.1 hypothetical protein [Nocardia otitidiscaviarum]